MLDLIIHNSNKNRISIAPFSANTKEDNTQQKSRKSRVHKKETMGICGPMNFQPYSNIEVSEKCTLCVPENLVISEYEDLCGEGYKVCYFICSVSLISLTQRFIVKLHTKLSRIFRLFVTQRMLKMQC